MIVTFESFWFKTASELFREQFSNANITDGYYTEKSNSFYFTSDTLIRDVRAWGAAALSCGLLTSFAVEVEN